MLLLGYAATVTIASATGREGVECVLMASRSRRIGDVAFKILRVVQLEGRKIRSSSLTQYSIEYIMMLICMPDPHVYVGPA
jgi:hypothetical protein